jgi:hypothetical protein
MAAGLAALTLLIAPGAVFAQAASHGAPAAARGQSQTAGAPTEDQGGSQDGAAGIPINGGSEARTTATTTAASTNGTLTPPNDLLTKVGLGLGGLALIIALAALGLIIWLRFMSPLRAIIDERSLEEALRQLIRAELRTVQDGRVAGLMAEINGLKERLAELEAGSPRPFPGAQADAAASQRPRGPAPLPADFHHEEPRERRPAPRPRAIEPLAAAEPEPAPRPRARPVDHRPMTHERAIETLAGDADFGRLMEDYGRCLAGERGALAAFMDDHRPVGVAEDAQGRFQETDDPDPAIWFVVVADSNTHGVLLPARKVLRDWDRAYRPMSGMKAKSVFGSSYEIQPGDRLGVVTPAWAHRIGPTAFERVARGELVGR